ncbi:MAG TPA: 2-oxoacid:ferredoxin oxidoreductase subunit beta [Feifaniaceae bacterium]|nr:2-oxoacid:ferredoxin oxidoreductase subunit beta [Feifaniaceae bacterium]
MSASVFQTCETAWCPGCGNFAILDCLKTALTELGKSPHETLMAAGIGQAAKTPQYIGANAFCGLHGRSLPAAVAAKIANESLTVIVDTGDGDSYGEGGNHFLHNIRRNVDITHFVHDNQIYGLTKGQASPTTLEGQVTPVQPEGSANTPFNPALVAIAAGAGFVARGFSGRKEHLVSVMKEAISYKGYALVDILQPCVSFNKVNTYAWYNQRTYELGEEYDPSDKLLAMERAMEFGDKIPLGILYRQSGQDFHEKNAVLKGGAPLVDRPADPGVVRGLMREFL